MDGIRSGFQRRGDDRSKIDRSFFIGMSRADANHTISQAGRKALTVCFEDRQDGRKSQS